MGFHPPVKKKLQARLCSNPANKLFFFFPPVDAILSELCSGIYSRNEFCQVHSLEQPCCRQEMWRREVSAVGVEPWSFIACLTLHWVRDRPKQDFLLGQKWCEVILKSLSTGTIAEIMFKMYVTRVTASSIQKKMPRVIFEIWSKIPAWLIAYF